MSNNLILGQAFNNATQNGYSVAVANDYNETPYPFRPVQCVENDIKTLDATNNFLYFTIIKSVDIERRFLCDLMINPFQDNQSRTEREQCVQHCHCLAKKLQKKKKRPSSQLLGG